MPRCEIEFYSSNCSDNGKRCCFTQGKMNELLITFNKLQSMRLIRLKIIYY